MNVDTDSITNTTMNEYIYDEIKLENEYSAAFSVQITQELMDEFMSLSGDTNPLHVDSEFAKTVGTIGGGGVFPDRVVYGMLVASFYSRLTGLYLPGKYCLLQRVDTHFHQPVFIGDTLKVSGFIKKKVEAGRTLVISAQIENQNGVIVNTAKIEAGCLK